ncbi:MAG: M20/M25/M40 family metallo-hydrolase [Pseudomonadales bacterium]|nr:M20/M25/M40 family metallo-hydrolase [Pseudomonadales bacterium]
MVSCSPSKPGSQEKVSQDKEIISADDNTSYSLLEKIIAIQTWRAPDGSNSQVLSENLNAVKNIIWQDLSRFNEQQKNIKFTQHEWKKTINGREYWVYSYRIGAGERLLSVISHLDTVPPGDDGWDPFKLRREERSYSGEAPQTFLVGRGAIDDKGPAVFALEAIKMIAQKYDDKENGLGDITVEMLFDTSEETGMSMPKYFADCPECEPYFGIVFDSKWCVRAEKGIERPTFSVDLINNESDAIQVSFIDTYNNPVNQIPGKVLVRFEGPETALESLKVSISARYTKAIFDDPEYRKASLTIVSDARESDNNYSFDITLEVAGAQHGSVPHKNRANGVNPFVSALNMIALLSRENIILKENSYSRLANFATWMWGTKVLGEHHAQLFARPDGIFDPGTTYAVTKINKSQGEGKEKLILFVDIRYALDHHENSWSGKDGSISGKSKFSAIFRDLTNQYNSKFSEEIDFSTVTIYAPDIRNPENRYLQTVNSAYKKIMGEDCPMKSIGGGTDAKGRPNLVAVGPLFRDDAGYPVNYHGINEAAPLAALQKSKDILFEILRREISGE